MRPVLRRIATLTPAERLVLVETVLLTIFFSVALRALPFRVVLLWASRPAVRARRARVDAVQVGALVETVGRRLGARCLVRALTGGRLLATRGVPHELHVGARRGAHGLEAHAWVSCGARVLVGAAGHDAYEPLLVRGTP